MTPERTNVRDIRSISRFISQLLLREQLASRRTDVSHVTFVPLREEIGTEKSWRRRAYFTLKFVRVEQICFSLLYFRPWSIF